MDLMNGNPNSKDAKYPQQPGIDSDATPARGLEEETADRTATLLTSKTVQLMLNVDKSTVYRMAQDGRLPAVKVGRQWRFPRAEMEKALSSNRSATPTTPELPPATTHPQLEHAIKQAVTEIASTMIADSADGAACTCSQSPVSDGHQIRPPSREHRPAESS
jgi:excisionase family DNA binding protein